MIQRNNAQARKIEKMTPELKSAYLASGRVTVGTISDVVKNSEGRNVFKTWYVAKIRGVTVGNTGEYKHETYESARQYGGEVLVKWRADLLNKLPQIGDEFEFDYTDREEQTKAVRLLVVDVTEEHVIYKIPSVSVNKIFPMDHETWRLNEDQRRPVPSPSTAP